MDDDSAEFFFSRFRDSLGAEDLIATLGAGLVGKGHRVTGPFGSHPLLYADYMASGRALMQIERTILDQVLPYYANSHTEASFCGARMTRLRRAARAEIGRACGAGPDHAVIFCGSGATAGLNRLVHLLGLRQAALHGARPLVILGPYEHHSNILPWRESGAEIHVLPEAAAGGPDPVALDAALAGAGAGGGRLVVVALSAASNITGHVADVAGLTRRIKQAGALSVWDYAGGGAYLPIAMTPAADAAIDAVVLSPHKFVGGPGASGVMILRRDAVATDRPTWPGGGTVRFVSPRGHDYARTLEAREEAGTPNVLGDIRAGLAFAVKSAVGTDRIAARNARLRERALAAWRREPAIQILGNPQGTCLPVFSFRIADGRGGVLHPQLVSRLLSDVHGVQARGGCACAGPYVHDLLGIDAAQSDTIRAAILAGREIEKPGFTRLNFSYLLDDAEADLIIAGVLDLATRGRSLASHYRPDPATSIFHPVLGAEVRDRLAADV